MHRFQLFIGLGLSWSYLGCAYVQCFRLRRTAIGNIVDDSSANVEDAAITASAEFRAFADELS